MKKFIVSAMVILLAACNDNPESAVPQNSTDSLPAAKDSVVVPVHEQHKDSSVMTED